MLLSDIQSRFLEHLFSGSESALSELFEPAMQKRLRIYRNNLDVGLSNYLKEIYPVIRECVGEAFFTAMVQQYRKQTPPRNGDIHEYGASLAEFIAAFPALEDYGYLTDIARLEWAHHRAYYAAPLPVDLSRMDQTSILDSRYRLNDGVVLIASDYPVASLWRQIRDAQSEISVQLDTPETALVFKWRQEVSVWQPDTASGYLLQLMTEGYSLARAIEKASSCSSPEQISLFLGECLQRQLLVPVASTEAAPELP